MRSILVAVLVLPLLTGAAFARGSSGHGGGGHSGDGGGNFPGSGVTSLGVTAYPNAAQLWAEYRAKQHATVSQAAPASDDSAWFD